MMAREIRVFIMAGLCANPQVFEKHLTPQILSEKTEEIATEFERGLNEKYPDVRERPASGSNHISV